MERPSSQNDSVDFDDNDSPLLPTIPLPQEFADELKPQDLSSKPRLSNGSATLKSSSNYANQFDQNDPVSPSPPKRTLEQTVSKWELEEFKAKLKISEQHREVDQSKLRKLESQMEQVEQFNIIKPKLQSKIAEMQTEIRDLRQHNKDLMTQNEHTKEQNQEITDLLEIATLDKEIAEEKADNAITELEAIQEREVDLETEVEMFKNKLEEMHHDGTTDVMKVENVQDTSLASQQLIKQNERLKLALIKLRDVTNENETLQKERIRELEREVRDLQGMQGESLFTDIVTLLIVHVDEFENIRGKLQNSEVYVDELKQHLDDSLASADLVEHLTEKNLTLTEQVEVMKGAIEDLEALKELSDELEESHNDTEKQMQEMLDYKELQLLASLKRIGGLIEATTDYENTILQFREHMQLLQR